MFKINNQKQEPVQKIRKLNFSNETWLIKSSPSTRVGPGPNYFSDSLNSVWVDQEGFLHLTIRIGLNQLDQPRYYCSEVILERETGYGKYTCVCASNVVNLDLSVVFGIFLYQSDEKEIDIEWARWGQQDNKNCQFVIQPTKEDNIKRFNISKQKGNTEFINTIIWSKNSVSFEIKQEKTHESLMTWKTDQSVNIPKANKQRFRINLWLFKGHVPNQQKDIEVVIKSFKFEPEVKNKL